MTAQDKARALIAHPAALGWALGYKDFKPNLHGEWIRWIVTGEKDGTLQAHRGSYKTTCLCVGIALLMMKERGKNIIFLRKTDNDVAEVVQNVDRILQSPVIQEIYLALTGTQLEIVKSTNTEIVMVIYCIIGCTPTRLNSCMSKNISRIKSRFFCCLHEYISLSIKWTI